MLKSISSSLGYASSLNTSGALNASAKATLYALLSPVAKALYNGPVIGSKAAARAYIVPDLNLVRTAVAFAVGGSVLGLINLPTIVLPAR